MVCGGGRTEYGSGCEIEDAHNFISARIVNELSTKVFRITGGEYQGVYKSVKKYQRLLYSIKEY